MPAMASTGKCASPASSIRHIVRLRQMLRRWRSRATGSSRGSASVVPSDVPAGYVAVRLAGSSAGGSDPRRYVVRAAHLNHPAFRELLAGAEEEYGFEYSAGPISIPCDEEIFLDVMRRLTAGRSTGLACRDSAPLLFGARSASSSAVSSSVW